VPNARLNVDGALGVRNSRPEGTHGYALFFRNGFFETVKVLSSTLDSGRKNLASRAYEEELIQLVQRFRAELEHLGVGKEMTCMLTITNANDVELGIDRFNWGFDAQQGCFDRETLVLPDVLLQADIPPEKALRPLFDLVWQAAGIERSMNYTAEGEWVARR
jgi:PAS domain-containing protein